jgi:glycerophosphoryl diester phosphodiesterase
MPAFVRAVRAGYGIELDVQLTKDQVPVVFHDFDLRRACGVEGDVSDYTYQQLQAFSLFGTGERIPRFQDVLELVDGKVPLLVELKYRNFGSRVCARADELLRSYPGEYVIESFHPWALLWYRIHRPEILRGQLSMNFQRQEGTLNPVHYLARHLLLNFIGRPDFIAYDLRDDTSISRRLCRRVFGAPSAAWTVKSQKQLVKAQKQFDAFIFEGFFPIIH